MIIYNEKLKAAVRLLSTAEENATSAWLDRANYDSRSGYIATCLAALEQAKKLIAAFEEGLRK